MGSQALGDLLDPFLRPSLIRERPAAQESTTRPPVWQPLIRSDADGGFRALLGGMPLTAQLVEHRRKTPGKTQTKRVRNLLCQGHRLLALRQPLVRIAQVPQRPGSNAMTCHA